ncbi:transcriptional regulator [Salinigranum rubrum]|nr:transcriptional regulator [Salinigranum rubrum]
MNEVDDAILEFFQALRAPGTGAVAMTPGGVHYNIVERAGASSKSRSTFSRRMSDLADAGLLEIVDDDRSFYIITDLGIGYLEGTVDRDEIPDPRA